jgi:hypothetical protein
VPGVDLIALASGSQNRVTGLTMTGAFLNAIHGVNMYRAIVTDNFETGGAANGIFLEQTGAGAQPSSYVYIARNLLGFNAANGILLQNTLADQRSHAQRARIVDNVAAQNGQDGIAISDTVSFVGTVLNHDLRVGRNVAVENGGDGIRLANSAIAGGRIVQGSGAPAAFYRNVAVSNGASGLELSNLASGDGAGITQAVRVDDNFAGFNGSNGIRITNSAAGAAVILQSVVVDPNVVVGNRYSGIRLYNRASEPDSRISQAANISDNIVVDNGSAAGLGLDDHGIAVTNIGLSGGAVDQILSITGNSVGSNFRDGINVINVVVDDSTVSQSVAIDRTPCSTISATASWSSTGLAVRPRPTRAAAPSPRR